MRCYAILFAVVLLLLVCGVTPAFAQKKVAVLVGCNEYDSNIAPPLSGCITDVKNIAEALQKQGFKVWMMTDEAIDPETNKPNIARFYPQKLNIERQLPIWIPTGGLDKGDTALFFFSGHGVRMSDGNDYLVPLGFQKVEPSDLVGLSRVYEILRKSGAENIVVITDACRNIPGKAVGGLDQSKGFGENSLAKSKSIGSGEQRYAFLRSCAEDQKSYERADGNGGNYAYYLCKGLDGGADGAGARGSKDGIITIGELYAYAKDRVMTEAQKKNQIQVPQYERKGDDPDSIAMSSETSQPVIAAVPEQTPDVTTTKVMPTEPSETSRPDLTLDSPAANLEAINWGNMESSPNIKTQSAKEFTPYSFSEPKKTATRYDVAQALGATFKLKNDNPALNVFNDVPADHPVVEAISELGRIGIIQGSSDSLFRGNKTLTRYEFASMLHRLIVLMPNAMRITPPDLSTRTRFSDIPNNHWAYMDIHQIGKLISGDKFNGNKTITCQEVTALLTKLVKALQATE